ncbi:MAG: MFS transporter [Deltaproteobacteria bacterium]|nr:MFS transporter [Deltaproteobacteria bacterium]
MGAAFVMLQCNMSDEEAFVIIVPQRPVLATGMAATLQGIGGGLGWSVLPATMPLVATELRMSHAESGFVWGAAALGIAIASPFGGAAVDRFGPRRVAGVAMLAGALACAARAWAFSPLALALTMLLFGMHVGFVAPSIPKALAGHVAANRLARANGLALLAYTLGTALTVLVARTVLAPLVGGWRPLMIVAAFAMALAGVLWLVLLRDRTTLARHASVADGLRLLRNAGVRNVAAIHFLLFGGYLALLGYLPRALIESGLSPSQTGLTVAAWLGSAGVANFAGPWLSDRIGLRKPTVLLGAVVAAFALAAVAFAPATLRAPLLALGALGGGAFAPLVLMLPLELPGVGPAKAGAALGLLMLVGQIGGFLLPMAVGIAAQEGGFALAIGLLAVVHVAIVLPARRLPETGVAAQQSTEPSNDAPALERAA